MNFITASYRNNCVCGFWRRGPIFSTFNPFPSLPSVATDDREQLQWRKIVFNNKTRLFSFIIMPPNSQVRGLCNPVVDSSLLIRMLNYHGQCFLT